MMEHSVDFGSKKITFLLNYSKRKTLGIKVRPDASVQVGAPLDTKIEKIKEVVRKKAMWIVTQQSYFLNFNPVELNYTVKSGYTILYLGRHYKILIEKAEKEEVFYKGNLFLICTKDKKNAAHLFEKWLKPNCKTEIWQLHILEQLKIL